MKHTLRRLGTPHDLNTFEKALWAVSLAAVTLSFLLCGAFDPLTLLASLVGVTALIFVAKGLVLGQILTIVFAVLYGVISCRLRYYGEMITYLGMTSPIAILAVLSWLRHPFGQTKTVAVHKLGKAEIARLLLLTAVVTAAFFLSFAPARQRPVGGQLRFHCHQFSRVRPHAQTQRRLRAGLCGERRGAACAVDPRERRRAGLCADGCVLFHVFVQRSLRLF